MSVRLRIFTGLLTAILVLGAVSLAMGFLIFLASANMFFDGRLTENIGQIAARYFLFGGVFLILLTAIGGIWISAIIIRHVTKPLGRLKKAANEIHDGNLNYELIVSGHDEFTELTKGFEQMRIRLKDSLRLRENAEAERRAMMAYITHDLKTPITSIIGYAEGILDSVADTPEKQKEYAEIIRKKAKSLKVLSDDLALLSNLENAALPLAKRDTDFGKFTRELIDEFFANENKAQLDINLDPGLNVSIDREKMARVLLNIFQNSVKYKKPDQAEPQVTVTLKKQDKSALITISDNGIEVSRENLPHLFDRFYRADSSRGKQSGSGLGLSIAQKLVLLHGGKIWIILNPGGGLSVNITLPVEG